VKPRCVERAELYARSLSSLYFNCGVWLVGSALTDPDPRDIDLVVPVPVELFLASYADPGETLEAWNEGWAPEPDTGLRRRWARDCGKTNAEGTLFCGRKVDFKTQPECFFKSVFKPRKRIDQPEAP